MPYDLMLVCCLQDADNIPLRVMLLLMDEVYDLREKNTWLRRRIVAVLKQLIKVTFGDSINKKIVDYVEFMTSAEQMAEYVRKFRYRVLTFVEGLIKICQLLV